MSARHVRFVPIADIIHRASQIEDRLAAVSPKSDLVFDHAASAAAFFFLRQPSRPNAPRPVANRGSAPGSGVASGVSVRNVSVEPLLNPQGPSRSPVQPVLPPCLLQPGLAHAFEELSHWVGQVWDILLAPGDSWRRAMAENYLRDRGGPKGPARDLSY